MSMFIYQHHTLG